MNIKDDMKRVLLKLIYGYASSDDYVLWLRSKGVVIGNNVHFYSPQHINVDITRPYAISIGDNVHITKGVSILTHGFDWCVLKGLHDDVLGSFGEVCIGNNVFIGAGATICKGVHIGNNVIIGTKSVVTKDCIGDSVYVGVPAKRMCSIEEYYQKYINRQVYEAKALFSSYYKRYRSIPPKLEFDEFFFLFEDRDGPLIDAFIYQMKNNGRLIECMKLYKSKHRQVYCNYESFVEDCLNELELQESLQN